MNNVKNISKKFLICSLIYGMSLCISAANQNFSIHARKEVKKDSIVHTVEKVKEYTKEKANRDIKKNTRFKDWVLKQLEKGYDSKEIGENWVNVLSDQQRSILFENDRLDENGTQKKMEDEYKADFKKYYEVKHKEVEKMLIRKKFHLKENLPVDVNSKFVFLNPGYGYDETGAVRRNVAARDINAQICAKTAKELLDRGYEVYMAFDLSYAKIELPKNEKLHILFKGRPPIKGKSKELTKEYKMFQASATCARVTIDELLKKNKNAKIISYCIHQDADKDKHVYGFRCDYTVDYNTFKGFQASSRLLADLTFKNCKNIFAPTKKEIEKNEYSKREKDIVIENWAMSLIEPKAKYDDVAMIFIYTGIISNPVERRNMKNSSYQEKMAKGLANAADEYFKNKKYKKK